jgi:hypothetical protein
MDFMDVTNGYLVSGMSHQGPSTSAQWDQCHSVAIATRAQQIAPVEIAGQTKLT